MIDIGLLFNKIIPMELLVQMPVSFVRRLRDLRLDQVEKQQKENSNLGATSPDVINRPGVQSMFGSSAMADEIMDELM